MVLPAALGSLAPYAAKAIVYGPIVAEALQALYLNRDRLGAAKEELYGLIRGIGPEGERLKYLSSEYRRVAMEKIGNMVEYIGPTLGNLYRNWMKYRATKKAITSSGSSIPGPSSGSPRVATAQAALIFLAFLGLTYFTLFPQRTTVHAIVPMTTNVVGLVLSFVLLVIGAVLVLRKES